MKLSTKAQNLIILDNLNLKKSQVPKFYKFFVYEWYKSKNEIIKLIKKNLEKKIIIRSSFYLEDNKNYSMAGEFEGSSNIKNARRLIVKAVNNLINQYKKKTNRR